MSHESRWDADRFLHQLAHKGKHDLGASIRAVRNFSSLLEEELAGSLTDDQASYLAFIRQAGDHLDLSLRRIAELARLDEAAINIEMVSIAGLLSFAGEQVQIASEVSMLADSKLLDVVFRELLENATRYGALPLTIEQHGSNLLCISDEGPGVDAARLDVVLQPFQRLVPKRHSPGVGLGLTIAARAMEKMGGALELPSDQPSGFTLHLRFPSKEAK